MDQISTFGAVLRIAGFSGIASKFPWIIIQGMEQEYRWSDTRDADGYRLPGPEHLGRWAAAAMFVSILLHVLVFSRSTT